jgi:hypothetical protein
VYVSIVPRGWGSRVNAVTFLREIIFVWDIFKGKQYRGCSREETRRDPDDDRDATWSWSIERAD